MAAVRPRLHLPARALLTCLIGLVGCASETETALLETTTLEPERVEPGVALAVAGAGFPAGRPGSVRLRGELHRPGRGPHPVDETFDGRAVSADRFEIPITDAVVDRLGGRGTFRGAVTVRFDGARDGVTVSGRLDDAELDVLPSARQRLAEAPAALRAARRFADEIGLTLAEEQPEEGARVGEVRAGSAAARAGLRAEDCIEAIDGTRLADLSDLRPDPARAEAHLTVRRADEPTLRIRVPLAAEATATSGTLANATWLTGLVLFLLLAAPTARVTARLARRPPDAGATGLSWLLGGTPPSAPSPSRARRRLRGLGLALAAIATLAAAGRLAVAAGSERAVALLLLTAAATRAVVAMGAPDGPVSRRLLRTILGTLATLTAAAGAALLAAARSGAGEAWPWRWLVFESPAGLLLFAAFALGGLGSVRPAREAAESIHHAARLHLLLTAGAGALLFLGGPELPFGVASFEGATEIAFVLQASALVAVGLWARGRFPHLDVRGPVVTLPLALLGNLAALGWLAWPAAEALAPVSGPFLCATTSFAVGFLALHRRRERAVELHLHPFL